MCEFHVNTDLYRLNCKFIRSTHKMYVVFLFKLKNVTSVSCEMHWMLICQWFTSRTLALANNHPFKWTTNEWRRTDRIFLFIYDFNQITIFYRLSLIVNTNLSVACHEIRMPMSHIIICFSISMLQQLKNPCRKYWWFYNEILYK